MQHAKRGDYTALDPALEIIHRSSPDLRNGNSNHAPMAAEALCAMGRADAVARWLDGYRNEMMPRETPRLRIARDDWRGALGRSRDASPIGRRSSRNELNEAPWREVVERWTARLAPGICGAATHGVIRAGHAVRGLAESESPARRHELADGLGYWATTFQTLPADFCRAGRSR